MGRLPAEAEADVDQRHAGSVRRQRAVPGVPGEDDVVVLEVAGAQHVDLADGRFLGRRAVEPHRAAEAAVGEQLLDGERGARRAHAEGRVATGVARRRVGARARHRARRLGNAGQRVELREDADHRPAAAVARHEGRRHAGHARLDAEALGGEQRLEFRRRARLAEAGLGQGPDPAVGGAEVVGAPVEVALGAGLQARGGIRGVGRRRPGHGAGEQERRQDAPAGRAGGAHRTSFPSVTHGSPSRLTLASTSRSRQRKYRPRTAPSSSRLLPMPSRTMPAP